MKKVVLLFCLTVIAFGASSQDYSFKIYKGFDSFDKAILQTKNDTIYVINFWATWCAPCIKELPYFEELTQKLKSEKVKVILVSLDFPKYYDKNLVPFLNRKNLKSEVVVLDDSRTNDWIDKVDPSWSGALPITVFHRGDERQFYEKEFHNFEELKTIIESFNR